MSEQPEALRLAEWLEGSDKATDELAAAELRGMHERIQLLYEQLGEAEKQLDAQYQMGVEAEREACAKVADEWQNAIHDPRYECDCATAIRARGEEPELESVTYPTAGAFLEEGWYSTEDLRDILKSLEDLNPGDDYA